MTRIVRLGLFIFAGAIILLLGLFAIGNKTFRFSNTFVLQTQFNRVAGLQAGASVQYQGISVGRVSGVRLPSAPGGKIDVSMAITNGAAPLITRDTQAQIKSDGLVGDQIIVLVSPADPGPEVPPDSLANVVLEGIDPFDVFEITDRLFESVSGFEEAARSFDQIMKDVQKGQGTLGKIVYDDSLYNEITAATVETRRVMAGLAESAEANADILVGIADRAASGIEEILAKVNSGDGTFARLLNDPVFYDRMLASADSLQLIASDLRSVTSNAEIASHYGAMGSFRFAELMEAAKHNWLFKRYFEERGFVEQAPFEIREQAITDSYRKLEAERDTLRAWEGRLMRMEQQLGVPDSLRGGR